MTHLINKTLSASIFRNRIKALTDITATQNINIQNLNNVDLLALKNWIIK